MARYRQDPQKYKKRATHYLDNAYKSIAAAEPEKAAEFLWGCMAQAIKAVAASHSISLRSHSQLREYANSLSKEIRDINIAQHFQIANSLHSNFYEPELNLRDVALYAELIRPTIEKLLNLASHNISPIRRRF